MLVTLEPGGTIRSYGVDPVSHAEQEIVPQNTMIEEAIAYYQGASSMYENMLKN